MSFHPEEYSLGALLGRHSVPPHRLVSMHCSVLGDLPLGVGAVIGGIILLAIILGLLRGAWGSIDTLDKGDDRER